MKWFMAVLLVLGVLLMLAVPTFGQINGFEIDVEAPHLSIANAPVPFWDNVVVRAHGTRIALVNNFIMTVAVTAVSSGAQNYDIGLRTADLYGQPPMKPGLGGVAVRLIYPLLGSGSPGVYTVMAT